MYLLLLSPELGERFQRNMAELFATAGYEQDGFPVIWASASLCERRSRRTYYIYEISINISLDEALVKTRSEVIEIPLGEDPFF